MPVKAYTALGKHDIQRTVSVSLPPPAPVVPPARPVVSGPHRYVRNPIRVTVVAVLTGQGLLLARPVLFGHASAVWAVSWAFVRWYEEPGLVRRFGADHER
jgi:protein-S-isoprenylcysteine O-methyltransferase Ste14